MRRESLKNKNQVCRDSNPDLAIPVQLIPNQLTLQANRGFVFKLFLNIPWEEEDVIHTNNYYFILKGVLCTHLGGKKETRAPPGSAILMSPMANNGETAVHSCHFPGVMALRMREVLARPLVGECVPLL